jgi:hypothetical protein
MVLEPIEFLKRQLFGIRVRVTGGHETEAVGRPQIPDSAFAQALVNSIKNSKMFAKVVEQTNGEDYLLTVTLFTLNKRLFGQTVKLEAGWRLQRVSDGTIVWQELIISEAEDFNVQVATEGAAKNNIAQGLTKISKLNL